MTDWSNYGEIPKSIIERGIDVLALNRTSEQKMQSVIQSVFGKKNNMCCM